MKKTIKRIALNLIARKSSQSFFEFLYWISLKGMNYGSANSPYSSGEEWVLKFIKHLYGDTKIHILDVGANEGQYANLINKYFQENVFYYGFEPSQSSYRKLLGKNFPKNYIFVNLALSDKKATSFLYFKKPGSVQSSLYANTEEVEKEEIKLLTLDEFCLEQSIPKIEFLKIDVEGHELYVIKGTDKYIKEKKVDFIQFEFGANHVLARTFFNDFFNILNEYKIYRVLQNGLREVKPTPMSEIFYTTNFLAVHKDIINKYKIKF